MPAPRKRAHPKFHDVRSSGIAPVSAMTTFTELEAQPFQDCYFAAQVVDGIVIDRHRRPRSLLPNAIAGRSTA